MSDTEDVKTEDEEEDLLIPAEQIPSAEDLAKGVAPTETKEDAEPVKDAPESSPSAEEPEEEESTDSSPKEPEEPEKPAPVEETTREKALRLELTALRKEMRGKSVAQMVAEPKAPETDERLAEIREIYSDEEIERAEKLVNYLADKGGLVRAEQSYQGTVNATLEAFTDEHPEYQPENDKDDIRWGRFKHELESGIYNLAGKTSKQLQVIFSKVHEDVQEELGEAEIESKPRKIAAQQQKVQSISHAGAAKSEHQRKTFTVADIENNTGIKWKGFDDSDFA